MPTNKETFTAAMNDEVDTLNSKTGGSTKLKVIQLATETATITPLNADTLTVTPTTSQQDFAPTAPKNGFESVTVKAISPIKTAADLDASGKTVTVPAGYYETQATKDVADGSVAIPNTSINANPSIVVNTSTGIITSEVTGSKSITPTVSAGYISNVSGATASVSGSSTLGLTTQAGSTITPTSSEITAVDANKYTLGAIKVEGIVCTNLSAGNIKDGVTVKIGTSTDDDSVTSITGTYAGGGSYTKPSYLISDGDSVSNFYFNTEYTPSAAFFSGLPYDQQDTYFNYTYLALGYLLAIDLSTIPNAGLTGYCLFWGDPNNPAIIYSTTTFDLSSVMAGMVVTTAGWQMNNLTPASAATMNVSTSNADFVGIMDEVIANDDVAFGSHGGGTLPQLNAPTQIQITGAQLTITPNTNNGNFADGYKIFVDNVQTYTTTGTTQDLSSISANQATITVKTYGTNFQDSPLSAEATYLHQYSISFYDGSSQMTGSPVTVSYGSTVAQAITSGGISTEKQGYTFDAWYSDQALTTEISTSTQIETDMTLYGKWTENAYITDETLLSFPTTAQSGAINNINISPNGLLVATFYITKSSSSYYSYLRVYKYDSGAYTRVGTSDKQINTTKADTIAGSKTEAQWISNTRLAVLGYKIFRIFDIEESTVTDVTSTYIPSGISWSSLAGRLSINSSGKLTVSQTNNSTKYIFDTTQTPFTYETVTWANANDLWIMDDNNLVAYVNYNLMMKSASDYSANPITLASSIPGRGLTSWHKTGDYLTYFGTGSDTGTSSRGCYRYHYSNGAVTNEQLVLGSNVLETSGAVHNIDGYWIVISTNTSVSPNTSTVYVYDTNGVLSGTVGLPNAVKQNSISNVSSDGTRAFIYTSDTKNVMPFKIIPAI